VPRCCQDFLGFLIFTGDSCYTELEGVNISAFSRGRRVLSAGRLPAMFFCNA
jgi:hypothetical protein